MAALLTLALFYFSYFRSDFPDSKCLEMCNVLLSIYRTMIFEVKLPPQVFQCHITPSLRKLCRDFNRFGIVAQETAGLQLITQLETDYGTWNGSASLHTLGANAAHNNVTTHTMSSSPSMDEMKHKMGKLFHRPSQGFWKK